MFYAKFKLSINYLENMDKTDTKSIDSNRQWNENTKEPEEYSQKINNLNNEGENSKVEDQPNEKANNLNSSVKMGNIGNTNLSPDVPKLSQNAQKLKDLEDKMSSLEVSFLSNLKEHYR